MNLKEQIKEMIKSALNELYIKFDPENIVVEVPKKREQGDFSTNIAMQLTKVLKDNSRNIAEKIVEVLSKNTNEIKTIEIAGPGFINIYLNDEYVFSGISNVIKQGENYGSSSIGKKEKVDIDNLKK